MKLRKIFCILIIVISIFSLFISSYSYAEDFGLGDLTEYRGNDSNSDNLKQKANNILGIIRIIGTVVSVIALIAIGIKYMMGSAEEKAEYKNTLWPYIVGAFIIFTGTLIPQLIYNIAEFVWK